MYKRFLNTNDYISIVTEEALEQLIRNKEERIVQAEESAEQSLVEYLTENYEIEKELAVGKNLIPYNSQITYPVGAHFYLNGKIYSVIRPINGIKVPASINYWEECLEFLANTNEIPTYSQRIDYSPGDIVNYNNHFFRSCSYCGPSFHDIRIPGVNAWEEVQVESWQANIDYNLWSVVEYDTQYFALIDRPDDIDLSINPMESDCWGKIGEYDIGWDYEFSDTEYVVYNEKVYYPVMNPNSDILKEGFNIAEHDPRNSNIKKHLLRLAVYELHKLISPTNVSSARIVDYETSMSWLRDASRLRINPGIPRKLDAQKKPLTDYALATYARDYDPYKNPWQI